MWFLTHSNSYKVGAFKGYAISGNNIYGVDLFYVDTIYYNNAICLSLQKMLTFIQICKNLRWEQN